MTTAINRVRTRLEVAAVGLLVPRLCRTAALGLTARAAANLAIPHTDPWSPLVFGTAVAWGRRR